MSGGSRQNQWKLSSIHWHCSFPSFPPPGTSTTAQLHSYTASDTTTATKRGKESNSGVPGYLDFSLDSPQSKGNGGGTTVLRGWNKHETNIRYS